MTHPVKIFVRQLRLVDLLLPAGAAIVSAGLQALATREQEERARLTGLRHACQAAAAALVETGQPVPEALLQVARPLDGDPEQPWLTGMWPGTGDPDTEKTSSDSLTVQPSRPQGSTRVGRWTVGLAAAAVLLYGNRGRIADAVLARLPFVEPVDQVDAEPVDALDVEPPEAEPVDADAAAADDAPVTPIECHWLGCDWRSDVTRSVLAQATAAAVHRNECVMRPAGAHVR